MSFLDTFVELDKNLHDRVLFDCGERELNHFIKTQALRHMKAGISRTMVLPSSTLPGERKNLICSFYTIVPSSISRESLPESLSKKLPHYPVPVFLIAQLAVNCDYQKIGLGKITLIKALETLHGINDHMRAYAVMVDCLNQKAEKFYKKYGFEELCNIQGRLRMFIPMKKLSKLFS